uniref:Uncharacterized protein n=2 Tax=Sipha flava TaxID=143950 RepID=A0A2S2Q1Z2_9HEMI
MEDSGFVSSTVWTYVIVRRPSKFGHVLTAPLSSSCYFTTTVSTTIAPSMSTAVALSICTKVTPSVSTMVTSTMFIAVAPSVSATDAAFSFTAVASFGSVTSSAMSGAARPPHAVRCRSTRSSSAAFHRRFRYPPRRVLQRLSTVNQTVAVIHEFDSRPKFEFFKTPNGVLLIRNSNQSVRSFATRRIERLCLFCNG